ECSAPRSLRSFSEHTTHRRRPPTPKMKQLIGSCSCGSDYSIKTEPPKAPRSLLVVSRNNGSTFQTGQTIGKIGRITGTIGKIGVIGGIIERDDSVVRDMKFYKGKLGLLVLQPTPFCNISCDYCYLLHRNDRSRMDPLTIDAVARHILSSGVIGRQLSVIWHAGEPLILPHQYYEAAFEIFERWRPPGTVLTHHFQTNGTLITPEWCRVFQRDTVKCGVSVDGPARLHDQHRRTRRGAGTHKVVMNGIRLLKEAQIPYHVICVLTRESLRWPDEIFDFFLDLGVRYLCFNVEEIEGAHRISSLQQKKQNEIE